MHIPGTNQRVKLHSTRAANKRIEQRIQRNVAYYARHPEAINARLAKLEREWDIERTLEANAATVTVASVLLGAVVNRKWFFMPAIVGGFLLQHAIQGWCPPLPVFRRFGVRTQSEIERERHALRQLQQTYSEAA